MNFKKACSILKIEIDKDRDDNIKEDILKKKYRLMALLYHPDKNNSPDSVVKFQEINESYEYLMKYQGYMEPDEDILFTECKNDTSDPEKGTYKWILYSFLRNLLKTESNQGLFYTIFTRVLTGCEKSGLEFLNKLDKNILIKILDILKKYSESFHFTAVFIEKIEEILTEKIKNDECIILNPTINDLFENNLYRLTVNNHTYIIPLWHHELVYDNSGNDVYVKINTVLPENVEIDDKNNIHLNVEYKIPDIWLKDLIEISIGKNKYPIIPSLLKLKKEQTQVFANQGISKINTENVFDISKKSDVLIHISLTI
jgi:hypothetical protein